MQSIARLLWIVAAASACGRVGFELREGEGDSGAIVPAVAEFEARCGASSGATNTIEVENPGEEELTISAASSATAGFAIVTQLPLAIPAGERVQVEVKAPAAIIGTDRPGAMKVGSLMLSIGEATHTVMLVATVTGADFAISDANGEVVSFDLTGTSGICPTPLVSQIKNTGSVEATLTFGAQSGFAISGFSGGPIVAGDSKTFTVRVTTNGPCSGIGSIAYVATGDVCTTVPTVLQATFEITGSPSCGCS